MKKLVALMWLCGFAAIVLAQENDDMYFRAKDRQKPAAGKSFTSNYEQFKKQHFPEAAEEENLNPTESYSARQVNPEFISRSQAGTAATQDEGYFDENYSNVDQALRFNNMYYYNNPWIGWNAGWNNAWLYRNWNCPWYSGYYDPWLDPWMSPWGYTPGWNYGFNNMWWPGYSGWSMTIGYTWGNNCAWNNWGPSYTWWNNWGIWNRPVYVIVQKPEVNRNYGKRSSQTNIIAGDVRTHYPARPRRPEPGSNINNGSSAGRSGDNDAYYVPPARRSAPVRQNSSLTSHDTPSRFNNSRSNSPSRNWNNNGSFNRSSDSFNNSRPSFSSPSRSGGSVSPGGGRPSAPSGGRSRGGH